LEIFLQQIVDRLSSDDQLRSFIEAGQIDCIVVDKIDRLSRSLLDFTGLIVRFEKRGIHLVSVTQQLQHNKFSGPAAITGHHFHQAPLLCGRLERFSCHCSPLEIKN
jgi:hypothetical protein